MRWKFVSLIGIVLCLLAPTVTSAKDPAIILTTKTWKISLTSYACNPASTLNASTPLDQRPPQDACVFTMLWDWTNLGPSGAYGDPSLSLILLDDHGNHYSPDKYQSDHMPFAYFFHYTKTWTANESRTLATVFFVPKGVKLVAVFTRDGSLYLPLTKASYATFDMPSPTPTNNTWGS